jgi:hypothetical protein
MYNHIHAYFLVLLGNKNNTTGATSGAETAYLPEHPTPVFSGVLLLNV